jgi:predicted RNA binding protein YcfA (HicA-like mRNA interferase family)
MGQHSYNSRELLKLLKDDGWEIVRTKGSHHQLRHPVKKGLVTIPHPKKDFPRRTIESILKQAGLGS